MRADEVSDGPEAIVGRDREGLRDDVRVEFNVFNEGTRLKHCLKMHKRLFGVEAKKGGGDTGYAGTDNRDYCKENGIQTSFVKRGRPFSEEKKGKDLVRKELARVRATAMEGRALKKSLSTA